MAAHDRGTDVSTPPAGWYADPDQPSAQYRYWDGTAWTHHRTPRPASPPSAEPPSAEPPSAGTPAPSGDGDGRSPDPVEEPPAAATPPVQPAPQGSPGQPPWSPQAGPSASAAAPAWPTPTPTSYHAAQVPVVGGIPLAAVGKRFGAAVIDLGVFWGVLFVGGVLGALLQLEIVVLLAFLGYLGYAIYVMKDAHTIGMMLLGLRQVSLTDGQPVSLANFLVLRVVVANVVFAIPLLGFVLLLMPLWDQPHRQSVGCKLTNSCVVDTTRT